MKTPEDIKKGLECCGTTIVEGRRTTCNAQCPYTYEGIFCRNVLHGDTKSYIVQLEEGIDHAEKVTRECAKSITENLDKLQSRLAQVERERDAAVADLRIYAGCKACKFGDLKFPNDCMDCIRMCNWQWRGVCPENTKGE